MITLVSCIWIYFLLFNTFLRQDKIDRKFKNTPRTHPRPRNGRELLFVTLDWLRHKIIESTNTPHNERLFASKVNYMEILQERFAALIIFSICFKQRSSYLLRYIQCTPNTFDYIKKTLWKYSRLKPPNYFRTISLDPIVRRSYKKECHDQWTIRV